MKQSERVAAVAACQYVDAVITDSPVNATVEYMRRHGFDIYTLRAPVKKSAPVYSNLKGLVMV